MLCAPTSKRSRSDSRSVSPVPESGESVADAEPTPQTYRTNEQMMQAMKGATMALGSMNKTMNLPSLQRIAMEFERENDIMEQRQEMMDDAIDDAMDVGLEEEGDEVVERVLEEIGVDLSQAVRPPCPALRVRLADMVCRWAKRQQVSRPMLSQKARLPKRLAGVVVAAPELPLMTMIFRHAWIACDDKPESPMWYLPTKRMMRVGEAWRPPPPLQLVVGCHRPRVELMGQQRTWRYGGDVELRFVGPNCHLVGRGVSMSYCLMVHLGVMARDLLEKIDGHWRWFLSNCATMTGHDGRYSTKQLTLVYSTRATRHVSSPSPRSGLSHLDRCQSLGSALNVV